MSHGAALALTGRQVEGVVTTATNNFFLSQIIIIFWLLHALAYIHRSTWLEATTFVANDNFFACT